MVLKGHGLMKNVGGEEKPVKESGVKRTYVNREAVVNRRNDDDDFVDPPPQIYEPTKKPKAHESTPQLEGKFVDRYFAFTGEILKTRIATSNLVTWFEKLNADQRKTVIEMGFGPVLNLKLGRIPTALGFWLVQNYNEHDMTLNVGNQVIHITPKLVSELMGIPNGRIAIEGNKTRGKDTVVVEWRSQYKNTTWIKRPLVRGFFSRAMTMKDAGRKFMLNFLVGFFTVVGETNENSVINQKFLPSVKKGVNVCELGWCDYVIRCLNRSKASWDPTSGFNGPLLLLALVIVSYMMPRMCKESDKHPIEWVTKAYMSKIESYVKGRCTKNSKTTSTNYENTVQVDKLKAIVDCGHKKDTGSDTLVAQEYDYDSDKTVYDEEFEDDWDEYNDSEKDLPFLVSESGNHIIWPLVSQDYLYPPTYDVEDEQQENQDEDMGIGSSKKTEFEVDLKETGIGDEAIEDQEPGNLNWGKEDRVAKEKLTEGVKVVEDIEQETQEEMATRLDVAFSEFAECFKRVQRLVSYAKEKYTTSEAVKQRAKVWEMLGRISYDSTLSTELNGVGEGLDGNISDVSELGESDVEKLMDDGVDSKTMLGKVEDRIEPEFDKTPQNVTKFDESCFDSRVYVGLVYDKTPMSHTTSEADADQKGDGIKQTRVLDFIDTQYSCTFIAELDKAFAESEQKLKSTMPVFDETPKLHSKDIGKWQSFTPPSFDLKITQLSPPDKDVDLETGMGKKQKPEIQKFLPGAVCSPYSDTWVSLIEQRTGLENNIANYLFSGFGEPWDVFFRVSGKCVTPRVLFESLSPGHYIHLNIIQAWAHILNYGERCNSKDSVSRLFCSEIMVHRDTYKSTAERNEEFERNMKKVLKDSVKRNTIIGFDLVFMPIIFQKHFYVMCFNLKDKKVEILDNSSLNSNMANFQKYEGWTTKMRDAFGTYLLKVGHPLAEVMRKAKMERLAMEWRTTENKIDCGIFAMRHMETYMGSGLSNWECGLCKEDEQNNAQKNQLDDLRWKYAAKIVLHDINERKMFVLDGLKTYLKLPIESRHELLKTAYERIDKRMAKQVD